MLSQIILVLIPFLSSCETPSSPLRAGWPKCRAGNRVLGTPGDSGRLHCPSLCLAAFKWGGGGGELELAATCASSGSQRARALVV